MADNRKIGRNSESCKRYAAVHQREKNKIMKLKKHLVREPNDLQGVERLTELKKLYG